MFKLDRIAFILFRKLNSVWISWGQFCETNEYKFFSYITRFDTNLALMRIVKLITFTLQNRLKLKLWHSQGKGKVKKR
jgi:hypothetical protein